jgi:predicted NBD/HSP70 family sugar kinase
MNRTIGVLAAEHIAAGVVENNSLSSGIELQSDSLVELPAEEIVERIVRLIDVVRRGEPVDAIGVGVPGIIRDGVVEESPNLQQMKGKHLGEALSGLLSRGGFNVPVKILNDADAMAAGIAANLGHLDKLVRVWWLGAGIGFGRYPLVPGVWEGGHMVVTLDSKEHFCQCGGSGHVEGIMGERAMRLRFLDLEPEEVFEQAAEGDLRCTTFVKLWHRALAAATATSVHLDGPGKFFISGPNSKYVQVGLLDLYVHEMVKMSPLQGTSFELVHMSDETAIIGAAVSATA